MGKRVLVIGGTRYFGKNLIRTLVERGDDVTIATRGMARDDFADQVRRLVVNRRDRAAMRAAFGPIDGYDIIFDQVCYNPLDALIAGEVFYGKVGRYVMASTIGVYAHMRGHRDTGFLESDIDLHAEAVDFEFPWHDPAMGDISYCMGKRQAEAILYREGRLPVTSVRIGHVLGGPEDFTGRLQHYVIKAMKDEPLTLNGIIAKTSFLDPKEIANFLEWVGRQAFFGPVNAGCAAPLTSAELYEKIGAHLGKSVSVVQRDGEGKLNPFDYDGAYFMDTRRAEQFGYRFTPVDQWLGALIDAHIRHFASGGKPTAASVDY